MVAGMILADAAGFRAGIAVGDASVFVAAGLPVGSGTAILAIFGAEFGGFAFAAVGGLLGAFGAAGLVLTVAAGRRSVLVLGISL